MASKAGAAKPASLRRFARPLLALVALFFLVAFLNKRLGFGCRLDASDPIHIFNSTLGFERIYAISFPQRTDKRDALVQAASLTGFDFEWSDAVAFEDISPKAAPPTWSYDKRSKGALGCWRAHMNVLQNIVHNKVQTALLLEDDADWDVSLKEQLSEFATGSRMLQKPSTRLSSPYGNDWDFLWLGHCKLAPDDDQDEIFVIPNDPTVPPANRRRGKWMSTRVPEEVLRNDTRLVFRASAGGLCTTAYAITFEGARKALSSMSLTSQDDVIDMNYRHMCRGRLGQRFNCLGPYPTLFGAHRSAGPQSRDSDLNDKSNKWHREYTFDIVYSTIQNIPSLVAGEALAKAQWPGEVEHPERKLAEGLSLRGRLKHVELKSLKRREFHGINID